MNTAKDKLLTELRDLVEDGTTHLEFFRNNPRIPCHEFGQRYQSWYTRALIAIKTLLPVRHSEFEGHYHDPDRPKLTKERADYFIKDYLDGLFPTVPVARRTNSSSTTRPAFDYRDAVQTRFSQQVSILAAAVDCSASTIADIEGTIQANILDTELGTAASLLENGHVRSAGVICGVVLERHLSTVLSTHGVACRGNTLSKYNEALKSASVIDLPTWRKIQFLGDIRNLCAHDGDREPTVDQVTDLISGANWTIKSVY